jgi:methylmalonyl-CoA mutase cobalamin-binding subunit
MDETENRLVTAGEELARVAKQLRGEVVHISTRSESVSGRLAELLDELERCGAGLLMVASDWHGVD